LLLLLLSFVVVLGLLCWLLACFCCRHADSGSVAQRCYCCCCCLASAGSFGFATSSCRDWCALSTSNSCCTCRN
jgi:hypothetical protein